MTQKEVYRCNIIQQVQDKLITQVKAAEILKMTDRQIRNLIRAYRKFGAEGLVSKKRGKRSNRAMSLRREKEIISLIMSNYEDFGPTLAKEKLEEKHNIRVSAETVRTLMIKHQLRVPRKKKKRLHQTRARRENFGELIQIDASIHDWFEGRGDKCALIVFIDDATSMITSLRFVESECTEGYFRALESHLHEYGVPLAIYCDRHTIFGGPENVKNSQLERALKELGIERILARSPQAKGRVERANRTLQDRLLKEMRLEGISTIEEANIFIMNYLEEHNGRFSKEPRGQIDTHRPLELDCDLDYVLSVREVRVLSKDLCISFYNKRIKILEAGRVNRLKSKKVSVIQRKSGEIEVYYRGEKLRSIEADQVAEDQILDSKEKILWTPRVYKPRKNHPWKRYNPSKIGAVYANVV